MRVEVGVRRLRWGWEGKTHVTEYNWHQGGILCAWGRGLQLHILSCSLGFLPPEFTCFSTIFSPNNHQVLGNTNELLVLFQWQHERSYNSLFTTILIPPTPWRQPRCRRTRRGWESSQVVKLQLPFLLQLKTHTRAHAHTQTHTHTAAFHPTSHQNMPTKSFQPQFSVKQHRWHSQPGKGKKCQ